MNRLKLLRQTDPNYFPFSLIIPSASGVGKLWLGDVHSLDDRNFFATEQIRTVVTCCKECKPLQRIGPDAQYANVVQLMIKDHMDEDLQSHFSSTYELIDKGRTTGSVLVHCMAGISRSASFVIAYLMRKLKIPYEEAYTYVKERRKKIKPNEGFVRQLQRYQVSLGISKRQKIEKENVNHNEKTTETEIKKSEIISAKPINLPALPQAEVKPNDHKSKKKAENDDSRRRVVTTPSQNQDSKDSSLTPSPSGQTKIERFRAQVAYFTMLAQRGQIYQWHQA